MFEPPDVLEPAAQQRLQVLRILHLALIMGVVTFAGVAAAIAQQGGGGGSGPAPTGGAAAQPMPDINILRLVVVAITVSALVAAATMRQVTINRMAAIDETPTDLVLANTYFTTVLLGLAIAEGAALLACIIVLMGKNLSDLGLVAAPLVLLIILTPTRSRWENFKQRVLNDRALRAPSHR